MKHSHVLSVGRIYCDINFSGFTDMPTLGHETFADNLSLHAGGGAYISASYFAKLGLRSSLLGVLPKAPFDSIVCSEAGSNAVSVEHCSVEQTGAPQVTVAMAKEGERAFLTHRTPDALPANYEDSIATLCELHTVDHLHVGELATLLQYPELIDIATKYNVSVSLDCGWDEDAFSHSLSKELIANVDVFLPNQIELTALQSKGLDVKTASLVACKRGAEGSMAYQAGDTTTALTQTLQVVDTIGAGDAFNAGFISGWLEDLDVADCLARGNACGGVAVSQRGGASEIPDLSYLCNRSLGKALG